jgi:hypothetical protein
MTISGKALRDFERVVHLAMGAGLLALAFTPLGDGPAGAALRLVVVPVIVLSGGLMWQHARVTRTLRAREGRSPIRLK